MADSFAHLETWFALTERYAPRSLLLREMSVFSGGEAPRHVRALSRRCGLLATRRNPVAHAFLGILIHYDILLIHGIGRLRELVAAHLSQWQSEVAELDAFVSVADFSAIHPEYCEPLLVDEGPTLSFSGIRHPFLPRESAVGNDLQLGSEAPVVLVSGSNMSGKSTLLRSVGIALVLARSGARVPAEEFRFRLLPLYSSMQVQDDLLRSTSLFYAEVRRIRGLLDAIRRRPTLFLLDEILRGTNERERHIAVRSILETLADSGSLGFASTHDVRLLDELCGRSRFRCVHFTETVDSAGMSFDYALRNGPVQSTNALRLLRQEGIEIRE